MRDGWVDTPLGEIVELGKGGSWGQDVPDDGLIQAICLRGTDLAELIDGKIPAAPVRWINESELKKSSCFKDMVLIETSGSKCGRSIVLTQEILNKFDLPVIYSNFCRTLSIDINRVTREFVEIWFSHHYANGLIPSYRATSAMPNLDVKALLRVEIMKVPTLPEQKRIVDIISSVDTYIEALEQQLGSVRSASNAHLEKIVSAFSDDWREVALGEVLEISRGGSPRPIQEYLTDSEDGINWVKIADATRSEKYIYSTLQKIKREGISRSREVFAGDFILSNSMSFGRPYIMRTDGCIHDGWLLLSKVSSNFDEDFLYNLLNSDYVQRQFESLAAGSGVRNLNIEVVKKVKVKIPTIHIQKELASVINEFDNFIIKLTKQLHSGFDLRNALLSDLLSGEHRIPESYDTVMGAA
jgi:type I restriction enzyme S subunit